MFPTSREANNYQVDADTLEQVRDEEWREEWGSEARQHLSSSSLKKYKQNTFSCVVLIAHYDPNVPRYIWFSLSSLKCVLILRDECSQRWMFVLSQQGWKKKWKTTQPRVLKTILFCQNRSTLIWTMCSHEQPNTVWQTRWQIIPAQKNR